MALKRATIFINLTPFNQGMASTFRDTIQFFADLGVYDVILPFLLVFTIVFAVLEKTRIFGTEELGGVKYTKKNLNSIVAFVAAFLVIASTRLVAAINESVANVVLLLMVSICFLLLIGSFYKEGEPVSLEGKWRKFFMVIMFIGVVAIFLQAIKMDSGEGVLTFILDWIRSTWDSAFTSAVILIVIAVVFILYITADQRPKDASAGGGSGGGHH